MKTTIDGITFEGTPQEMHEFRLKVTPTVSNPNLGLAPTPSYTNVM
jgi:hypothetical protein